MKLGSFDIDVVSDGTFALDGGAMFGVVPRVVWEKHFQPDDHNRVRIGLNCLLVSTGQQKVLVDTGIGHKWDARLRDRYRIAHETDIVTELRARGLAPEDIDLVINTHLHFDHAGTNTVERNGRIVPTFPRARYVVQRGEFEHALAPHERDQASYNRQDFEPLAETGQLDLIDGDREVAEGVQVFRVPGHNRDHQCVRVDSDGETLFVFADTLPTAAHVPPAWVMSYDLYPVEAVEQKKQLTRQAIDENWACLFYHDPKIPLARLHERDGKVVVEAIPDDQQ